MLGKKVTVPVSGVKHLIAQAYEAGDQYQWASEAATNAIQAHATWIKFGFVKPLMEKCGVIKRMISDNGSGMDEDELMEFMTSFGGGGRPIGMDANFGQGFKSSCFPWNGFGIIVMSWTEKTPEGRMIWIERDNAGDYGLRTFEVGDEGSEVVIPGFDHTLGIDLAALKSKRITDAGHGTIFILLGKSLEDNTEFDVSRDPVLKRGIAKYLNERFIEVPEDVIIASVGLETKKLDSERRYSKDKTVEMPDGTVYDWHSRIVRGARWFIPETEAEGSIIVDKHGTIVEWYLCKDAGSARDSSYGPGGARIMIEYGSEFEGLTYSTAYDIRTSIRYYREFGISDLSVAQRVWLIVRPPVFKESAQSKWGVLPQASRSRLLVKGGGVLPWETWEDEFYQKFPHEIRQAIEAARSGAQRDEKIGLSERIAKMLARLNNRFRPMRIVEHVNGTAIGTTTDTHTGVSRRYDGKGGTRGPIDPDTPKTKKRLPSGMIGDVNLLNPDDQGDHKGIETRRGDGWPAVRWEELPDEDGLPGALRGAIFTEHDQEDGSAGVITLNPKFTLFVTEFDYWQMEYPKADPNDVTSVVKLVYREETIARVKHIMSLRHKRVGTTADGSKVFLTEDYAKSLCSPEALTSSLLGLVNVEQRIRTILGARFGAGMVKLSTMH